MAALSPVNSTFSNSLIPAIDQPTALVTNALATEELALAVFANNEPRVVAALASGADPNGLEVLENMQQPIFFRAACHGSAPIVTLLLTAKALINQTDPVGTTALYSAVSGANSRVVKCLLSAKADPELGLNYSAKKPLELAASMAMNWPVPSAASIDFLIQAKADVNGHSRSSSPIIEALKSKNTSVVQFLLDAKADPSLQVNSGSLENKTNTVA